MADMTENDKDKVAEDLTCALLLMLSVRSILVSIVVGFISGPGAGFLTMGGFVALFAFALVCGAKMKARKEK